MDSAQTTPPARGTGIAKRVLTNVFLRLYGSRLARKYREAPATAYADTITFLTVHLGILVGALLWGAVWIALWAVDRRAPQTDTMKFFGIVIGIGVTFLVNRRLKREFADFVTHPELAEQYRPLWQRLIAAAATIFFVFSWVGLYWLAIHLIRSVRF